MLLVMIVMLQVALVFAVVLPIDVLVMVLMLSVWVVFVLRMMSVMLLMCDDADGVVDVCAVVYVFVATVGGVVDGCDCVCYRAADRCVCY